MNQEKTGKLIKKVRKNKSLTQQDLADLLNLSLKLYQNVNAERDALI